MENSVLVSTLCPRHDLSSLKLLASWPERKPYSSSLLNKPDLNVTRFSALPLCIQTTNPSLLRLSYTDNSKNLKREWYGIGCKFCHIFPSKDSCMILFMKKTGGLKWAQAMKRLKYIAAHLKCTLVQIVLNSLLAGSRINLLRFHLTYRENFMVPVFLSLMTDRTLVNSVLFHRIGETT